MTEPDARHDDLGALPTIAAALTLDPSRLETLAGPYEDLAAGAHTPASAATDPTEPLARPTEQEAFHARYESLRPLGQGGMGEVRLVRDRRIGREIALKNLHPSLGVRASAVARFLREARVQGQLEHPSVVPVYDLGVGPDGEAYFTMMRVQGHALDVVLARLAQGDRATEARYTRRRLLSAFSQLCLAVDYAHARGVLHRDLKPANVMLGDFGEVRVLDWGLAKVRGAPEPTVVEAHESDASHERPSRLPEAIVAQTPSSPLSGGSSDEKVTAQGSIMGTPGYMAPEQAIGRVDELDARTDVYALGAILFELLTLAPLHPGQTAAERIVSTVSPGELSPARRHPERDVPPELDEACVRALAREPAARTSTARELGDAIERYLDGDRDLARRRALAREQTERARALAARVHALTGLDAEQARADALRAATRALALDSRDLEATALLAKMLIEVPDTMPARAREEMERGRAPLRREAAGFIVWRTVGTVLVAGLASFMGVRSWGLMGLALVSMSVASAAAVYWWRRRAGAANDPSVWLSMVGSSVALTVVCTFVGPFVGAPTLAMVNALLFGVQGDFRRRPALLAFNAGPVLLGAALQLAGVLPGGWEVHRDHVVIRAGMINFWGPGVLALLLGFSLMNIAFPLVVMGRMKRHSEALERTLFMHSWHLRNLVPEARAEGEGTDPAA